MANTRIEDWRFTYFQASGIARWRSRERPALETRAGVYSRNTAVSAVFPARHGGALPVGVPRMPPTLPAAKADEAEILGEETWDLLLPKQARYQLRYTP